MAPKIEAKERAKIVALLQEHGGNQRKTAKLSGRSQPAVRQIAIEEGITSINSAPKKANDARRDYSRAERRELLNELFDHAREMLPNIKDAKELQALTITIATAIDKMRLEDGEATSRGESMHKSYDMSKISGKELDEFERILTGGPR